MRLQLPAWTCGDAPALPPHLSLMLALQVSEIGNLRSLEGRGALGKAALAVRNQTSPEASLQVETRHPQGSLSPAKARTSKVHGRGGEGNQGPGRKLVGERTAVRAAPVAHSPHPQSATREVFSESVAALKPNLVVALNKARRADQQTGAGYLFVLDPLEVIVWLCTAPPPNKLLDAAPSAAPSRRLSLATRQGREPAPHAKRSQWTVNEGQ